MKITSAEFEGNINRYQEQAQHAPVAIMKDGRIDTVLISGEFFFAMAERGQAMRSIKDLLKKPEQTDASRFDEVLGNT